MKQTILAALAIISVTGSRALADEVLLSAVFESNGLKTEWRMPVLEFFKEPTWDGVEAPPLELMAAVRLAKEYLNKQLKGPLDFRSVSIRPPVKQPGTAKSRYIYIVEYDSGMETMNVVVTMSGKIVKPKHVSK